MQYLSLDIEIDERGKGRSISVISATPTATLRPAHLDAVLVGFPSQMVPIVLSLPLASKA